MRQSHMATSGRWQIPSLFLLAIGAACAAAERPNVVLVMADDQGWGQMGYYNHPVLKTPNLDAMAQHGLRFDRFYAGAPNCSPTRATVLTGRTNDRTGVHNHGYPLRRQERTAAQAMRAAGYATGHFGKWHLNGLRGPGVPVLQSDNHNPGEFGFEQWLSVTNFFDRDPVMSRNGKFEDFKGDSSEIIVDEALKFIAQQVSAKRPFFAVIWYGTPHSPWMASADDKADFHKLNDSSREHYGELVALDRSVGTLRKGLRDLGVADNTLVWYCSDNGGLPKIVPETVGGLRGFKNSVFEGGLRVPAVVEWPAGIKHSRVTSYPAGTVDIFPTLVDLLGLPASSLQQPSDGRSLVPHFQGTAAQRDKPLGFRHTGRAAWIDNDWKLVTLKVGSGSYMLFNLKDDPHETKDLSSDHPEVASRLRKAFETWNASVDASVAGKDYPAGKVDAAEPSPRNWTDVPEYEPYFEQWRNRPEYRSRLK